MARSFRRQGLHTLAEINVTPLLDLAFVLLIIFMITTPLLENRLDLDVPASVTAPGNGTALDPARVNVISVDRRAAVQLDGEPVDPDQLAARLLALKQQKGDDLSVVIRADRELPIQRFVSLMDVLRRVHVPKVGIVTQDEAGQDNPTSRPAPPGSPAALSP